MGTSADITVDNDAKVVCMSDQSLAELRRVMVGIDGRSATKIDAIKWLRQRAPLGLKDSKEFVENLALTMRNELGPGWVHAACEVTDAFRLGTGMLLSHVTPTGNRVFLFEAGTVVIDIETTSISVPTGIRLEEMQSIISMARGAFGLGASAVTVNLFRPAV